jgi:hypothetical protein
VGTQQSVRNNAPAGFLRERGGPGLSVRPSVRRSRWWWGGRCLDLGRRIGQWTVPPSAFLPTVPIDGSVVRAERIANQDRAP